MLLNLGCLKQPIYLNDSGFITIATRREICHVKSV